MKRLVVLSAVLIALIIVAWAAGMFGGSASTVDLPEITVDSDQVNHIDVVGGGEHVRAIRNDSGTWELVEPVEAKADTATVMRLVRQLDDIELESIVSTNPERFGRFQVDSTGSELTVEWGTRRLELFVGKMGPDFQSRYVRLDGDDRVMLATGVPNLSAKLDQWRDKTLWSFPAEAVTGVSITSEGTTYGIARRDSGWVVNSEAGELEGNGDEIATFLTNLASLKADGFHTGLTVDSVLTNVSHQLRIELADGSTETLLMRKRTNDVAAILEGSSDVLKLFSYRVTSLTPSVDKLSASQVSS